MKAPTSPAVFVRELAVRTALLFPSLSIASFGLYVLFHFVLPWHAALMGVLSPVFAAIYAPALWAGAAVSQSDYPLLEAAVFALVENFVLALLIARISLWFYAPTEASGSPWEDDDDVATSPGTE